MAAVTRVPVPPPKPPTPKEDRSLIEKGNILKLI